MNQAINNLLAALWQQYIAVTPSAQKIHHLFERSNKTNKQEIVNDHIALRTFAHPTLGLAKLAQHFLALGYQAKGNYVFKEKKLKAKHFEHDNTLLPKIFISELLVTELTQPCQKIINNLLSQVNIEQVEKSQFLYSGTHWQLTSNEYKTLLKESEYAAWLAAWGFRANHFTVSINHLSQYSSIAQVNQTLKKQGFMLNDFGGEIKGSVNVMLEQSATIADKMPVQFSDCCLVIPSCFYEFAKRYPDANGVLFQGFVEASADKIFQSTDNKNNH